ncbi:uncharacterized protein EV420DRAFT_1509603 [Desarmillaria tabescens]|uniref:Uncharacterized protein n=1 Tax=Armillaria tabescens TaxID=1929756 RepID=A0AA39NI53_ARMTA|nr:uncharacterized protein EV420DRAFT_1509603 [Desarmillaria tabescens]KAK0466059.1 hypothetical protein EV420DRAFT_1509603 [Desarmillaria tabescens]
MTSAPQDVGNTQRVRSGPAASHIPDPGDMALQVQQATAVFNTSPNEEAIDVATCADTIGRDKYQVSGQREKLEDPTPGDDRDQILESMKKQIAELERGCEAKDRKIVGMKTKTRISAVAMDTMNRIGTQYILDCAQARLALSAGLVSHPLQSAKQGSTALRSYLEKWTNPQDRLAAVRDLLAKCDDDEESRTMSEDLFGYLTVDLNVT